MHLINLIVRALNSEGVRDAALKLLEVCFRNEDAGYGRRVSEGSRQRDSVGRGSAVECRGGDSAGREELGAAAILVGEEFGREQRQQRTAVRLSIAAPMMVVLLRLFLAMVTLVGRDWRMTRTCRLVSGGTGTPMIPMRSLKMKALWQRPSRVLPYTRNVLFPCGRLQLFFATQCCVNQLPGAGVE